MIAPTRMTYYRSAHRRGRDAPFPLQDLRRGAGAVERVGLENRSTGNCTVGSNPTLSAIKAAYHIHLKEKLSTKITQPTFLPTSVRGLVWA